MVSRAPMTQFVAALAMTLLAVGCSKTQTSAAAAATPPVPSGAATGAPTASLPEGDNPPDLFRAVKEQLGLALQPGKGPVELIVIDHIEKTPTEN